MDPISPDKHMLKHMESIPILILASVRETCEQSGQPVHDSVPFPYFHRVLTMQTLKRRHVRKKKAAVSVTKHLPWAVVEEPRHFRSHHRGNPHYRSVRISLSGEV